MANTAPVVLKETINGCLVDRESYEALVKQAYDPEPIANPGDPVITYVGNGSLTQNLILDRWPKAHSFEWAFRTRVNQPAGTGWGWLAIPNAPAGFQPRPIIKVDGTYRAQSTTPQDDDGSFGAAPRGPFMGQEAHHWTSTQRIYASGYFRRDNPIDLFVEYRVEYVCS